MEMSGHLHALGTFPQGNRPWYSLDRRLGGPQSQSGSCGEDKSLAPAGNQTLAIQPVACRYAEQSQLFSNNSSL
jgi:hypothetical protein